MDCYVFPWGLAGLLDQTIDWIDNSIICIAFENDSTPSTSTNVYISDIDSTEVGRTILTGKTITLNSTNIFLDCDDPDFSSATSYDLRHFVIAKDTGDDDTSKLMFWLDYASSTSVVGMPFVIPLPENGLHAIACSANIFPNGIKGILDGSIDLLADTIKCALYNTGTAPDYTTHIYMDDLECAEVSGVTRQEVVNFVGTVRSGRACLYADDVILNSVISTNLQYAVVYHHSTATDSDNTIIYVRDYGTTIPAYNQSIRVEFTDDFIRGI